MVKNGPGAKHDRLDTNAKTTGVESKNQGNRELQFSRLKKIGQGVGHSESARVVKTSLE